MTAADVLVTPAAPSARGFGTAHQMTPAHLLILTAAFAGLLVVGGWFGWQLIRQNGRTLLRLDELEARVGELENGESEAVVNGTEISDPNETDRADRFARHSLARTRIARNGLKPSTPAPDFSLPRLDGGQLSLSELRGRRVLLVFSDPNCAPCDALAPKLERWHQEQPEIAVVMISRGQPAVNRAKVREHGISFPVVLQQHWEISRRYAMFATPSAYLIDENGVTEREVAVGEEAILDLAAVECPQLA